MREAGPAAAGLESSAERLNLMVSQKVEVAAAALEGGAEGQERRRYRHVWVWLGWRRAASRREPAAGEWERRRPGRGAEVGRRC